MKKDPNRFCTRFSDEDLIHFRAMDILEKKGRKKADFIARSVVLHDAILEKVASGQQLSPDVHFVLLQLLQCASLQCSLTPLVGPISEVIQSSSTSFEGHGNGDEAAIMASVQPLLSHSSAPNHNIVPPLNHSLEAESDIGDEENHLEADDEAAILGAWNNFGDDLVND